jgi:hypothetical protein
MLEYLAEQQRTTSDLLTREPEGVARASTRKSCPRSFRGSAPRWRGRMRTARSFPADRRVRFSRRVREPGSDPNGLSLGSTFLLDLPAYWLLAETTRLSRLEGQFAEARLLALKAQLQPHFLFNAINTVSVLMREDADAADDVLKATTNLTAVESSTTAPGRRLHAFRNGRSIRITRIRLRLQTSQIPW